ncbi:hypothetical protein Golax_020465 [Gossypium laxum]|uniref:Transposase MuDR plant domain-containing protein n=1 Tax=Gossypium laxum TaxID=34288 RepID=A0A7J9B4I4_9ROSI|nr:hypothetical protein [Gossypium laxum]
MVVEAEYRAVNNFAYCEGELDFSKGLSVCYDNSSFIVMINHIRNIGFIRVYVEHEVDTPDIIGDTMLLVTIRERELNSGIGELFTELGEESNVGSKLGGSSDACVDSEEESSKNSGTSDIDSSLGSEGVLRAKSKDEEGVNVGEGSERGEKNGEVSDESSGGTNYINSSDLESYRSDSDGAIVCRRSWHVCFDPTNLIPYLELDMVFNGPKEFKNALAKYAVNKRFDIVYFRNEKGRTRARGGEYGCLFRIYATVDNSDGFYKIKTFIETHECLIPFKNKRAFYKFVGEHFLGKIRVILKLKLSEMQKLTNEELKVDLSKDTYRRAKRWALEEINGRVLWD